MKKVVVGVLWLTAILITGCGNMSIKHLVIPTEGMSPTINPGDHLGCAGIKNNDLDPIERFDIVAYHRQPVPSRGIDSSTLFAQRVIGMPGETIEMRNGAVYINGKELDQNSFQRIEYPDNRKELKVLVGSYFLLGDNRPNSEDSRFIGAINRADIVCKATTIISKTDYDNGKRW